MILPKSLTTVTPLSKILAGVLFVVLPVVGFFMGMEYQKSITTSKQQSVELSYLKPTSRIEEEPEVTNTGIAEEGQIFTIGLSQFQIPEGWVYSDGINPYFGDVGFGINPPEKTDITTNLSFFSLRVQDEVESLDDLEDMKNSILNQFQLDNLSVKKIQVSGVDGYIISGIPTPPSGPDITCGVCYITPFNPESHAKFAIFFYKNRQYSFMGDVVMHESDFDAILSTFKFIDTEVSLESTYQIIDGSLYVVNRSGNKAIVLNKADYKKDNDSDTFEFIGVLESPDRSKMILIGNYSDSSLSPIYYYEPTLGKALFVDTGTKSVSWSPDSRYAAFVSKPTDSNILSEIILYDTQMNTSVDISQKNTLPYDILGFGNIQWLDDSSSIHVNYTVHDDTAFRNIIDKGKTKIVL